MPQLLNENEVSYYLGLKHIYPKGSGGGGGTAEIPVVEHTASETTVSIEPNEFHIWPEMSSLNITLDTPADLTILNEYMIQFESGSTPTTLSLPASLSWYGSAPSIEANKIYQISIINNVGIIGGA